MEILLKLFFTQIPVLKLVVGLIRKIICQILLRQNPVIEALKSGRTISKILLSNAAGNHTAIAEITIFADPEVFLLTTCEKHH